MKAAVWGSSSTSRTRMSSPECKKDTPPKTPDGASDPHPPAGVGEAVVPGSGCSWIRLLLHQLFLDQLFLASVVAGALVLDFASSLRSLARCLCLVTVVLAGAPEA